jgi:hypothetical protein
VQFGVGVLEAAQPDIGVAEIAVDAASYGQVGQTRGGGHGRLLGSNPIVPVPRPVKKIIRGPGQLPSMGVEPVRPGVLDQSQQNGVFGGEPFEGLPTVCGMLWVASGLGWDDGDRVPCRLQSPIGGECGVQVVV